MIFIPQELLIFFNHYLPIEEKIYISASSAVKIKSHLIAKLGLYPIWKIKGEI